MGERDLLKRLLERRGKVHFGRLSMKPGKPTTFATVDVAGKQEQTRRLLVFGLPGNPVSAQVTSHLLVLPALRRLAGVPVAECLHAQVDAVLAQPIKLDPERPEYHRAALHWTRPSAGGGGYFLASSTGVQMSSRLLSILFFLTFSSIFRFVSVYRFFTLHQRVLQPGRTNLTPG